MKARSLILTVIAVLCLLAWFFPGRIEHPAPDVYLVVLGLIQPGWLRVEVNQPFGLGTRTGAFVQPSWSWLFFAVPVLLVVADNILRRWSPASATSG
jgi:hypothetical protein